MGSPSGQGFCELFIRGLDNNSTQAAVVCAAGQPAKPYAAMVVGYVKQGQIVCLS